MPYQNSRFFWVGLANGQVKLLGVDLIGSTFTIKPLQQVLLFG